MELKCSLRPHIITTNTLYRNAGILMIALLVKSIGNFSLQIYDTADNPGMFETPMDHRLWTF